MSTTEKLIRLTTRLRNIVVNLPEVNDSMLEGYVRIGARTEAR